MLCFCHYTVVDTLQMSHVNWPITQLLHVTTVAPHPSEIMQQQIPTKRKNIKTYQYPVKGVTNRGYVRWLENNVFPLRWPYTLGYFWTNLYFYNISYWTFLDICNISGHFLTKELYIFDTHTYTHEFDQQTVYTCDFITSTNTCCTQ